MWGFWILLLALLFLVLLLLVALLVFMFAVFIAHARYLHLSTATCRCFCAVFSRSAFEEMVFALCCNESTTLYFDATVWSLSHWRYTFMWIGFLYSVVVRFPALSGVTRISRKGVEPSSPASSLVNCMCMSMQWRCLWNSAVLDGCRMIQVSSRNLLQKRGMWCCVNCLVFKLFYIQVCHNGFHRRSHGRILLLFMLVVTDVIIKIYVDIDIIGKCYCHVVLMADSLCHCDR